MKNKLKNLSFADLKALYDYYVLKLEDEAESDGLNVDSISELTDKIQLVHNEIELRIKEIEQ